MDEKERREYADAHRGEIEPGFARRVEPRELGTIMSVRMPSLLAVALREEAVKRGVSVSDLLRTAAERLVGTPIGWECEHFNITSLPGVLGRVSAHCGCELRPVYDPRRRNAAA